MVRVAVPRRLLLLLLTLTLLLGCQSAATSRPGVEVAGMPLSSLRREPVVRVRIISGAATVRLAGAAQLRIAGYNYTSPVTIVRQAGKFLLHPPDSGWLAVSADSLVIEPAAGDSLSVNDQDLPGTVVLHANTTDVRFDVINHVAMERYLPGVLDKELYASWHPRMFEAQAIAARSYAIAQMGKTRQRAYDMQATTASQVYGGTTRNAKALAAVAATRGKVLAWDGLVFPAYFSSSSGGTGQDAILAMKDAMDIPPLRGKYHGGWSAASPRYRWTIVRDRQDLSRRLAAWGQSNRHAVAGLRDLTGIAVTSSNSAGRPTRFTLSDASGSRYVMGPEDFRFAANHGGAGLPPLAANAQLYSSHVEVRLEGNTVHFAGRGHGHGVGLDQWGAQAMAQAGHSPEAILAFYYPGASILAAY
ncbi:MAG: SpoIID/LytB domain-containing protein [Phycisphaeraceae bacterium]